MKNRQIKMRVLGALLFMGSATNAFAQNGVSSHGGDVVLLRGRFHLLDLVEADAHLRPS